MGGAVLIVDTVANTGAQIAATEATLSQAGIVDVIAVAVVAQEEVLASWAEHGRTLLAIEVV